MVVLLQQLISRVITLGALVCLMITTVNATPGLRGRGFILNNGQWPTNVIAFAKGSDVDVWVTKTGMVYDHHGLTNGVRKGFVSSATWSNATLANTPVEIRDASSTLVTFFKDAKVKTNPSAHVAARLVSGFVVKNVYPGVDIDYKIEEGNVRFDIHAENSEQLKQVGLSFSGSFVMNRIGSTPGFIISDNPVDSKQPYGFENPATPEPSYVGLKNIRAFQNDKNVDVRYWAEGNIVRFDGAFLPNQPLIIDPTVYGTYLGGPEDDMLAGIRLLSTGEVVVGGTTTQIDFPVALGKYAAASAGTSDGFIAVYDAALTTLKRYTFIGGNDPDSVKAIAVDAADNIYAAGTTLSSNFPITGGTAGQIYKGQIDAFALKIKTDLSSLIFSTFIGGNKDDIALGIAVDGDFSVFVCGATNSTSSFPTNAGFKKTFGGLVDGFLTKLSSSGASYVYSTYFGVEGTEQFNAIVVENSGSPIVTGFTNSANFQTFPVPSTFNPNRRPYDRVYGGGATDAFITKFGQDGGTLVYSTFIGGLGDDDGKGIFVDDLGRAYLIGETTSTDMPTTLGFKQTLIGGRDVFLFVLSDDGKEVVGCTYYGGVGDDRVRSTWKDKTNAAVIGGSTTSNDFQVEGAGTIGQRRGASDGFIAILTVGALKYATLVGGSSTDEVTCVIPDANDDVYACGISSSTDLAFPVNAVQRTSSGKVDGFIIKSAKGAIELTAPSAGDNWCLETTQTVVWAAFDMAVTDKYRIEISMDNGATWTEVVKDLTTKSYSWKPKNIPAGNYKLRVVSSRGHESMTSATFRLGPIVAIATQPTPVAVCVGKKAEFTVVATGEELKYKWRKDGVSVPLATSATLTIPATTTANAGTYIAEVTGKCGSAVFTTAVTLKVETSPFITEQPQTQSVEEGKRLLLSVTSPLASSRYQWKKNGVDIPGATSREFSIAATLLSDSGNYSVTIVTDCGTIDSEVSRVTITPTTSVREVQLPNGRVTLIGAMPVSEVCKVRVEPVGNGDIVIRIVDVQGLTTTSPEVRLTHGQVAFVAELPCSVLANGAYMLDIRMSGQQAYLPFVVSR